MPVLTVNGTEYSVPAGIRLSDALARANVSTSWPCGGLGRCGKCRVKARGALSEPEVQERQLLSAEELAAGVRLACRTYVLGDCKAEAAVSSGEEIATRGAGRVAAVRPAFSRYGAAVDLGTTTLAARIYDASGRLLASGGRMNPQSRFGADVISRIQASMDGARGELAACVREGIAALLAELCEKAGLSPAELDGAVIAGNTAMLYLLTASAPDALSRAPFEADRLFGEETDAAARQVAAIRRVLDARGMDAFPEAMRETVRLRLAHPTDTLAELAQRFDPPISKPGLSHRLKRITEFASKED